MSRRFRVVVPAASLAAALLLTLPGCAGPALDEPALADQALAEPVLMAADKPQLPSASPVPGDKPIPTATSTNPGTCPFTTTSRQLAVETALASIRSYGPVIVDGVRSDVDCATVKRFQVRMAIAPANGQADATTVNVAQRIAATRTSDCNAGTATMACVDLTHQTFYLMKGGAVVLAPTVTRTGMAGFAIAAGSYPISYRSLMIWSNPYSVWLPYWQHFYRGAGLHETTTYIHNMPIGSHGCINLLRADAIAAYNLLRVGNKVRLYGRRPGT